MWRLLPGAERIEAVQAAVQLKQRRKKLPR
jgi:hypothetical protein